MKELIDRKAVTDGLTELARKNIFNIDHYDAFVNALIASEDLVKALPTLAYLPDTEDNA